MPHAASFVVGSLVAGTGFLVIHRNLSHRSQLSYRWPLEDSIRKEIDDLVREARSSANESKKALPSSTVLNIDPAKEITQTWNNGVNSLRSSIDLSNKKGTGTDDDFSLREFIMDGGKGSSILISRIENGVSETRKTVESFFGSSNDQDKKDTTK